MNHFDKNSIHEKIEQLLYPTRQGRCALACNTNETDDEMNELNSTSIRCLQQGIKASRAAQTKQTYS